MSFVGKGDKNFFVKDFEDGQWDFSESDDKVFYAYQLTNFRGITIGNTENKTVKYAIARIGDNFFTFIDDQYICCASPIDYRSLATVPGIFGSNFAKVQTTNISVMYDRVEHGTQYCAHSISVDEEKLKKAICRALNKIIEHKQEAMDLIMSNLSYAVM